MRLLLLEDQESSAETLIQGLEKIDSQYQIVHVKTVAQAIETLESDREFDVALVDLGLPDAQGEQAPASLCKKFTDLAVVIYTGDATPNLASDIMRMGAQDFISKGEHGPISIDRVLRFAIQRNQRVKALKEVANSDVLTGLLNRRGLQAAFDGFMLEQYGAKKNHLSLYTIDLDGFKAVNDDYGHPAGDLLLQQTGQRIQRKVIFFRTVLL